MKLREYQSRSLAMLYDWLENNTGHVAVSLPTGSGKSVVIAELCRQAVQEWPDTRILMLTRSMELIGQNAEKLRTIWPGAPLGIYSASIGRKELGEPITIGGPLSIVRVLDQIGHCDLLICDECHDISHKDEGTYRKIISHLSSINPSMRVIGYTASPFRMGHGLITDKPAIFDAIIEPTSIEELVSKGYLCKLRSKSTKLLLNTDGVKKRGGEFIESELQAAVDTEDNNTMIVQEVIRRGSDRKSWMFFCTGVEHAEHIKSLLIDNGISTVCVTGDMPKHERVKAVNDFKAGKVRAVTQVNCLSTGFDHSGIDLIAMARPTMSPGLYLQAAGRGLRPDPSKDDCLFLDFAGVVSTHGPITNVQPPKKGGKGEGEAPVKVCEQCDELCAISAKVCPACCHPFPIAPPKPLNLHQDDIMGIEGTDMEVKSWQWRVHTSKASGKQMLKISYYGSLSDPKVDEYLAVAHEGYAGQKAMGLLVQLKDQSGAPNNDSGTLEGMVEAMNQGMPPSAIEYKKDGKFFRVIGREWR